MWVCLFVCFREREVGWVRRWGGGDLGRFGGGKKHDQNVLYELIFYFLDKTGIKNFYRMKVLISMFKIHL